MKGKRVFVIGVGMTKFEKPKSRKWQYPDMAVEAGKKALADAGIKYEEIQQAVVGYVFGDSTCGQRAIYGLGLTGIPITNVNNACSTGSTALAMARQLISGGLCDCTLALGFEQMKPGSLSSVYTDRVNPIDKHYELVTARYGFNKDAPGTAQLFAAAGREHMEKYGTTKTQFAKIGEKNHRHSVNNPYAQFQKQYTLEEVENGREVTTPLTLLQCSPTSDGSAAAILASEDFVIKHGLQHQAVEIIGQSCVSDSPATFNSGSLINMVGAEMTNKAAKEVYQQSGLGPSDIQVIELHDCFSANELLTYEALGLCAEGQGGKLVDSGDVTYGGKWVVNPSGGLISKGHPLGATGLAQCCECTWQLRKMAGNRQVPNAQVALQHNLGLGGLAVVTMYRFGFPDQFKPFPPDQPNPATDPNVGQAKL